MGQRALAFISWMCGIALRGAADGGSGVEQGIQLFV